MTRNHRSGHRSRWNKGFPESLFAMQFDGWRGRDFSGRQQRKRRRRIFDSGELRLVLLKLIADEARHGYDLIRAIEELTGGAYTPSPGIIYPTLNLLEDSSLIEPVEADGSRKAFAATDAGRAEIEEKQAEVEALLARLSQMRERENKAENASVRRAMGNLFAVLGHRFSRDDTDEALARQITEILDETAQRIERL
ncbi:PadR family transcriptional regulator [Parasphingopyxis lamellibrachiae]|uniref:PadR family transcriptional regulator n=1 Tax=Parasphingopyxis lamellibrachiae TaxID=680125 RepID=A0A3D9FB26_9SPHN|nr:PadR family transcriptional regulator [Parasphingopyxis lamellibrachiae]RED15030.1 PadR family transcriptional regulator [Parasphingopyxis lamellibrachiae]